MQEVPKEQFDVSVNHAEKLAEGIEYLLLGIYGLSINDRTVKGVEIARKALADYKESSSEKTISLSLLNEMLDGIGKWKAILKKHGYEIVK